jgi:glycine/serine hydroxymethyltransferase
VGELIVEVLDGLKSEAVASRVQVEVGELCRRFPIYQSF